jgi:putative inorganic carbon (HCO3(-)) transporter
MKPINPSQPSAQSILDSRWYAFADLICVVIAGLLWAGTGGRIGWWPLIIALLPWPACILNGRFPITRTPFDPFMLLFLITAVIGTATAYNGPAAWAKLWLIAGAILLFYALAGQPPQNIWPVWGGMGLLSTLVALYFLLSNSWIAQPAYFGGLQKAAQIWSALRPGVPFTMPALPPSLADGLAAMFIPALAAASLYTLRQGRRLLAAFLILAGLLSAAGLLLTSSRSAWLALAGGLFTWLLWTAARRLSRSAAYSRRAVFLSLLLLLLLIATAVILLTPGGPAGLAAKLPGPSRVNRLSLSLDTINLIRDYPLTGSGLASFPGQYSQYSQITPVFLFEHAHNLFLDIALEQGLAGLVALLAILGITFWLLSGFEYALTAVPENDLLHGSLLAALAVLVLNGLVDDPLYATAGLLLLFALSGITAAITHYQPARVKIAGLSLSPAALILAAALIIGVLAAAVFHRPLQSAWQANSGAVAMAKVELDAQWPENVWQGDTKMAQLGEARSRFEAALNLDPENVTALYRLGLIALAGQDFETAVAYLSRAYELNPYHRGIRKALGYSALWNGDPQTAETLLTGLPEIEDELSAYSWWWNQQDKPQQASLAYDLLQTLQGP